MIDKAHKHNLLVGSRLTEAQLAQAEQLFQRFWARDYWSAQEYIASRKAALAHAHEQEQALDITPQMVEDEQYNLFHQFTIERTKMLDGALNMGDAAWLEQVVRYSEHLTLDLWQVVTGEKVRGMSNRALVGAIAKALEGRRA